MRKRGLLVSICAILLCVSLLSGCEFDVSGPTYTNASIISTLKQYGITGHYASDQGSVKLLAKATGDRSLLQIDYIDQYEVKGGWVEVYLYGDAKTAYQEALMIRKDFDERFRYDQKVAELQGRTLDRAPLPLFQHGNAIVFGGGVSDNEEMIDRITKTFGEFKNTD